MYTHIPPTIYKPSDGMNLDKLNLKLLLEQDILLDATGPFHV